MTMDEPICCPQCGAPGWITERFRLGSTAGPVEQPLADLAAETLAGPARPHPGVRAARARLSPS